MLGPILAMDELFHEVNADKEIVSGNLQSWK